MKRHVPGHCSLQEAARISNLSTHSVLVRALVGDIRVLIQRGSSVVFRREDVERIRQEGSKAASATA